jgi:hypothetical protein
MCRFFKGVGNWGDCRKHAPIEMKFGDSCIKFGSWPQVKFNDWCGDYEGKIKIDKIPERGIK